jgi:hypothetical protein
MPAVLQSCLHPGYHPHFVDRREIEHTNHSHDSSGGNGD